MPDIRENYLRVRQSIEDACTAAHRPADAVELLAVSKRFPPEIIHEAIAAGHRVFGESRIQEAEGKLPSLPPDLDWHFIGHIQKNKVRKVLQLFDTLHSVDSLALARRVDHIAGELGKRPKVFLQVNIAAEESKHGFTPDGLRAQMADLLELQNLEILGLMAIPPAVSDPAQSRPHFRAVRELQHELGETHGCELPQLSMGMSGDYQVAIEEGSTIVRVGSSIFGQRPPLSAT